MYYVTAHIIPTHLAIVLPRFFCLLWQFIHGG